MFKSISIFFTFLLLSCGPNSGGPNSANNGLGNTENSKNFSFEGVVTNLNLRNTQTCEMVDISIQGSIDKSSGVQNQNPNHFIAHNPLNQFDSVCIKRRVLQILPNSQALQVNAQVRGTFVPFGNVLAIRTIEVVGLAAPGSATNTSSVTSTNGSSSGNGAHGN